MRLKKLSTLLCLTCLSVFAFGQFCDGGVDNDGDGYFSGIHPLCPLYDLIDSNPCYPQNTACACDFDGDGLPNCDDNDDDCDGVVDFLDPDDYDPNTDTDGDGLSDQKEIGFDCHFNPCVDTDPNNPDTDGDGIIDSEDNYQSLPGEVRLSSNSLCTNAGACQKVCANWTVNYTAVVPDEADLQWFIEGADSVSINVNTAAVTWGAQGHGSVMIGAFGQAHENPKFGCGQMKADVDGSGTGAGALTLPFLNLIFSQHQYSIDNGETWNAVNPPIPVEIPNLSAGEYTVLLRNEEELLGKCSFTIETEDKLELYTYKLDEDCGTDQHPFILKAFHSSTPSPAEGTEGHLHIEDLDTGFEIEADHNFSLSANGSDYWVSLAAGTYSVTATDLAHGVSVTKLLKVACDCPTSDLLCVEILPEPKAEFSTVPAATGGEITICRGQPIQFENQSTTGTTAIWNFGNGATALDDKPEYTYPEAGIFEVMLIARNTCFCADTAFLTVNVNDAQIADIQCVGTVCQGDTATYSTAVDCSQLNWQVSPGGAIIAGGGASDNSVTVDWAAGTPSGEWVQLQALGCAENICPEPVREAIAIIHDSLGITGPTQVCPYQTVKFSLPDFDGTNFHWYISPSNSGASIKSGQGTPEITVKFGGNDSPENLTIRVNYNNCFLGCGGQAKLDVQMVRPSYVSGPREVCQGGSPTFQMLLVGGEPGLGLWEIVDASGEAVWQSSTESAQVFPVWDFPLGEYTIQPLALGETPCTEGGGLPVSLVPPPPVLTGISGNAVICPQGWYNYVAEGAGSGTTVHWLIENGPELLDKTGPSANVLWGDTPPFRITAWQTDAGGCPSEPLVFEVSKLASPEISGPAASCKESTSTFAVGSAEGIDFQWAVSPSGAGTISAGQGTGSIEVFWQKTGPATVSLTACGETATSSVEVGTMDEPEVTAPASLCREEVAAITTTQAYESYRWEYENGQAVSTSPSPELGPGFYTLTVGNPFGCSAKNVFRIEEKPTPEAFVLTLHPELCDTITSTTLMALQTHDGLLFDWALNGTPIGENSPFLEAGEPGAYTLLAQNAQGCTDEATLNVSGCGGGGGGGGGGNFNIDSIIVEPIDGFPCPFEYEVETAVRQSDCSEIDFYVPEWVVQPDTAIWTFQGTSNTFMEIIYGTPVTVEFPSPGFYSYRFFGGLAHPNVPGAFCWAVSEGDFTVPLKARFSAIETCPGLPTEFTDGSNFLPTTGIAGWAWDFGDPGSGSANFSTEQHPTHVYENAGEYPVTLTVTSTEGCVSVFTETIQSHGPPVISAIMPSANCADGAVGFTVDVSPNATVFAWDFGEASSGEANFSSIENPWHTYAGQGSFTVGLSAKNAYGCESGFSQNLNLESNNLSGEISPAEPAPFCEGLFVELIAPAAPAGQGLSYLWSSGNAGNSLIATESGIYEVTISDPNGCTHATQPVAVEVVGGPEATISALELNEYGQPVAYQEGSFSACDGEEIILEMNGQPKYEYLWSDGSTGGQIAFSEGQENPLPPGSHDFTVTVTDISTGCTAVEGPFPVTVLSAPVGVEIESSPQGPLCDGTEATFTVTDPQPDLQYQWNTGESGTEMTAIAAGSYFAQATNAQGCSTNSGAIEINHAPSSGSLLTGCFSACEPRNICLPGLVGATVQWYVDDEPVPAPYGNLNTWTTSQSGDYAVHITSPFGCETYLEGLSLEFSPQVADLAGVVLIDANGDGQPDPAVDSPLPGAWVYILQNFQVIDSVLTDETGHYFIENYPAGNYMLNLDLSHDENMQVIGPASAFVQLTGCTSIGGTDFLVQSLCPPQPLTGTLELSACEGSSANFLGTDIPVGGSEVFNLASAGGCDSILTVSVGPLFSSEHELVLSACDGGFVEFLGTGIPAGSSQVFILENQAGCDSVLTVAVAELPHSVGEATLSACAGSSVNFLGTDIPAGGSEVFILENQAGCDSVLTVAVTELPHSEEEIILSACADSYAEFLGTDIPAGGSEVFVLENYLGCDSILAVSVKALVPDTTLLQLHVCEGETIDFQGVMLSQNETVAISVTDSRGCDSVLVATALLSPETKFATYADDICPGTVDGSVQVFVNNGAPPYLFSIDGESFQAEGEFVDLGVGEYTVSVENADGCLTEKTVAVPASPPLEVAVGDYVLSCNQGEVVIEPTVESHAGQLHWQWQNGSKLDYHTVDEPGIYSFQLEDDCSVEERQIEVAWGSDLPENQLYIPNAFSPNGDQINDLFRTYAADGTEVQFFEIQIFNRWGGLVFKTFDHEEGWDGMLRGKSLNPGVYAFFLRTTLESCGVSREIFVEGDVTLLR